MEEAVILAAGRGSRLGALTATAPKPLLEVGGRPAILHIAEGLVASGVRRLVVVTGYRGDAIVGALRRCTAEELVFIHQGRLDGTASALALARPHLHCGRFLFSWGDILVEPGNYRAVARAGDTGGVLAVNEVADPADGAAVYVDARMRVRRLVEKPAAGTSATRWNNAGLGVLTDAIWEAIGRLEPSPRGEYELPRAIAALIEDGVLFTAVPISGPWFDIGTPQSLEAARRAFAGSAP